MNSGENTINRQFVDAMEAIIKSVQEDYGDLTGCSLVTISTNPKIFSNGMDLLNIKDEKELGTLFEDAGKLLSKLVSVGMPTIAMVDGHAFAAGFYMVISHDYVIMKKEKGYLCFNEMQFGAPVNEYNSVLAKAKMGTRNYHELYLEAKKINAEEAHRRGIVHIVASEKDIHKVTQEFAEKIADTNKDTKSYEMTKADIYKDVIHSLTKEPGINQYAIEKIFGYKSMLAKM
uniref:Enoyl-CoA hydratase n=1 Tax=Euplotes harpa TaxID=151035 RepID=A0A7S3JI46_9SPIT